MLFSELFYDTQRVKHRISRDICENPDMPTDKMRDETIKFKTIRNILFLKVIRQRL